MLKLNNDMFIPRVIFKDIPILMEAKLLHQFLLRNETNWKRAILKEHPRLDQIYSFKKEGAQISFLKEYITEFKKQNAKIIQINRNKYFKNWEKIETPCFRLLQEIFNINWPKEKKEIEAMLSINPICPRFLDSWSFTVFYRLKVSKAREIILHECSHFLYFCKWRKIYPKRNKRYFEVPYADWYLSELVTSIVLNDKRIQRYLKKRVDFYDEPLEIKGKNALEFFTELYRKHVKAGNGFELFLKNAYLSLKKYNYKKNDNGGIGHKITKI